MRAKYRSRKHDRPIHLAPVCTLLNPGRFRPRRCSLYLALNPKANAAQARIEPEMRVASEGSALISTRLHAGLTDKHILVTAAERNAD